MYRIDRIFIISLVALVWSAAPSLAQKRIALIIGNSNYTKIQSLPNPEKDSQLMALTLNKLGFEVISAVDADRISISRAVRNFGKALRKGGKDAVGLFFYAGHGVQARGENYLIPLGAEVEDEADLDIEAISASAVLAQMEAAGNSLNMVILDACRNNPYKAKMRSNTRGLTRVNAASGSLIAFAAAPGQVAADGNGENSPYTTALVEAMQVPGLSVEQMFKRVRISVEAQTNNQQTPWEESSLRGEFYFNPARITPADDPIVATQPPPGQQINPKSIELSFWNSINTSNNPALFQEYLNRYNNGIFAFIAKLKLEELQNKKSGTKAKAPDQEEIVWEGIANSNERGDFAYYIRQYPRGKYVGEATARITALSIPSTVRSLVNPGDKEPVTLPSLIKDMQRKLYELNYEPGRPDGKMGSNTRQAIRAFQADVNLPADGNLTRGLVNRLRQAGTLNPWGAIVYQPSSGSWGMAWGEVSRAEAIVAAQKSCGGSCEKELTFYNGLCGAFAYGANGWALSSRTSIKQTREQTLSSCKAKTKDCKILAAVCAGGSGKFVAAN